ncbi:SufD family Fe-S cluster assembly protein [Candidatus Gottesmanbacteria bacterium]|nr:SufD family Fe-S cluster assembly protein [Candidatus Gottesmanbacteria bacterium]
MENVKSSQKILFFKEGLTKEEVSLEENGNLDILGIVLGQKDDRFDIDLTTNYLKPNSAGKTEIRIVLKDHAVCNFKGLLKIGKQAHQTKAFLSIKTLLLSDGAKIETIPSLEIEANDVAAGHAATVGRPEEEQIFYLTSRGLTKIQAKNLLTEGFLGEIVNKIADDKIRTSLWTALQRSLKLQL